MSTYSSFVNSAYSANTYDSPSAWYSNYSADFYKENNIAHPLVRGIHDDVAQSLSDFESKLEGKIDSLAKVAWPVAPETDDGAGAAEASAMDEEAEDEDEEEEDSDDYD
ncbi:hypothetical protein LR48_Vigan147s000900 [Vigna angularis]|uniref:Uncharacterized protein n=1 Tax=Phaseolus angularis TaxID=3914 RepID=A0A0L9T698_PHAAN|nr:hypothetical protein LR48_Vigan147s000900 [Vigna angularis]